MQFDATSIYSVHVVASSKAHLEASMSLAFNGKWVTGYGDYGDFGLVYFWFSSTLNMFQSPILKSMNDKNEYVLHEPKEYHMFDRDYCVGEVMDFAWEWILKDSPCAFDITTDPGYNTNDIMCIIRKIHPEY